MQPNTIFQQISETDATTQTEDLQAEIVTAGQDATLLAVLGQVNNWFATMIPKAREVEYGAADATKQNNFALFTAIAQGPKYAGIDFITAWEAEYSIVYG